MCSNPRKGCVLGTKVTCQAHHHVYRQISKLWGLSLCPKTKLDDPFYKLECVQSECPSRGFDRLPIRDKELDTSNDNLVEWHKFEKVFAGKIKTSDKKEVLMLKMKRTNLREFFLLCCF